MIETILIQIMPQLKTAVFLKSCTLSENRLHTWTAVPQEIVKGAFEDKFLLIRKKKDFYCNC